MFALFRALVLLVRTIIDRDWRDPAFWGPSYAQLGLDAAFLNSWELLLGLLAFIAAEVVLLLFVVWKFARLAGYF